MKHLKSKLLIAVTMLLIATLMMGTASYAWFTISTNPEVKDLTATVVVNESLEIAYRDSTTKPGAAAVGDAKKSDTYGNLIDSTYTDGKDSASFKIDYALLDKTLRPATLATSTTKLVLESGKDATAATAGTFYAPVYDTTDGRIDYFKPLDEVAVPGAKSGETTGVGYLCDRSGDNKATADATGAVTGGKIYGYYFDLWVRTNVAGDLQICNPETDVKRSSNGTTGSGTTFTVNKDVAEDKTKDIAANTTLNTAKEALAKNIGIACAVNGDAAKALTKVTYVADSYKADFTDDQTIGTFVATGSETKKSAKAPLNSDVTIRVYVYLEGAELTNKDASIDGGILGGAFSIQFQNSNVDKSMDNEK